MKMTPDSANKGIQSNGDTNQEQIPSKLLEKVKIGDCILFLGASIHAPPPDDSKYVYPEEHRPSMGGELSKLLATECNFESKLQNESPYDLQRVSLCYEYTNDLGRDNLIKSLRKYLANNKKPSPALAMLARLPFKIIVTTNYDHLLETAFSKSGKEPKKIIYNPSSIVPTKDITDDLDPQRPVLFKIHGDLDEPPSIVITDEDYITFVQRMSDRAPYHPVPEIVAYYMKRWPTLFIGYSLRDYNLRLLLRTLRWKYDKSEFPTSFAIDMKPDPLILRVWQNERNYIMFITQNLWKFIPRLYKQVKGKEYPV
jgi:hypothetical protein